MIPVMLFLGLHPMIRRKNVPLGERLRGDALAFASGLLSCLGSIAFFGMLAGGTKAATAIALTSLAPLVTVVLAVPVLNERLSRSQLLGVTLSLAAVYFFNVRSEEGFFSPWLIRGLVPIGLWGVAGLLQKMATNLISGERSALLFLFAFLPVAVWIYLRDPLPPLIAQDVWIAAFLLGFFLALGNLTILLAFASHGKASIIAPMAGLYPLVSIPIAVVFLREAVVWREGVGIILATLAVIALSQITEAAPEPVERIHPPSYH
jgi:drug/metabolite transporter (DMT)-like permease